MAAEYRFLFTGLLDSVVNLEVPVYGVSFGRTLNQAGDGTLSINLDREGFKNQDIIDATVPGKSAVYFERNGALIWGGILWSRTYQSQAKVLSYTMQTFESFFNKIVIESTLQYKNTDQRNIVCDLVRRAQQKTNTNINVLPDVNYPFSGGIMRSVDFFNYDTWTFGKALDYMVEYDEGLDWTIEVFYDDQGRPAKRLRVDNVLGAPVTNTGLIFDYPGDITNYYFPESTSGGAVSVVGVGAGEGTAKLITRSTDTVQLEQGYPDLQEIYSNQDVSVKTTLVAQTIRERDRLHIPITVPTIEVDPSNDPELGTWNLGDYARIAIEDSRFTGGVEFSARVIGYTASPPASDGAEQCSLILSEADDLIFAAPPAMPTPPTSSVSTFALWHNRFDGPNLRDYPANVQDSSTVNWVLLAFAQPTTPSGSVEYSPANGQSNADHAADIRAFEAKGIRVSLGLGGGGVALQLNNDTDVANLVSSVGTLKDTYGFTGVNLNIDVGLSTWNQSSVVKALNQFKTLYGTSFMVGITAQLYDPYTAQYISMANSLGGNLDYMSYVLYDFPEARDTTQLTSVTLDKISTLVSGGIPVEKQIPGYMLLPTATPTYNASTPQQIHDVFVNVKAQYPTLRGLYLWEDARLSADYAYTPVALIEPTVRGEDTTPGGGTPPVDPPPPPPPNPTPQSKTFAIWHHRWSGPNLRDWPSTVQDAGTINQVYLAIAQSAGNGAVYYENSNGQSIADHAADVRAFEGKGIRVSLAWGGSGDTTQITNDTQVSNFVNSIVSLKDTYGFTGVEMDMEPSGTAWNQASIVKVAQQLKSMYGQSFQFGVTAGLYDPYTTGWLNLAAALGSNMDYMTAMLYDFPEARNTSQLTTISLDKVSVMIGGGIPVERQILGYMLLPPNNLAYNASTPQQIHDVYAAVRAQYPTHRGMFIWEDGLCRDYNWTPISLIKPVVR